MTDATQAEQIADVLTAHPLLRWVETSDDDRWECSCSVVLNPYNEDASAADAEELWAAHVAAAITKDLARSAADQAIGLVLPTGMTLPLDVGILNGSSASESEGHRPDCAWPEDPGYSRCIYGPVTPGS